MSRVRTVDFLPEIFQTDTNRQFLAATLDQLVQEPKFKKTQGFIGRRVGPGVNPNDDYVVEIDKTRADYQLEAGIVSLKPDTDQINDVITYPGLLDSIDYQGGDSTRPDRLFESQYYTWDPFVNWDTFINFSQYFWLPEGPDAVDVAATGVPASDNFVVTRANGVYSFSGVQGQNPTLTLVRGGSYTFQVAQNEKETVNYRVTNSGTSAYLIDFASNPTLTLARGNTYVFNISVDGDYPFYIKTLPSTGTINVYSTGVTNNGARSGNVIFTVPQDAPDTLYYAASTQSNMQGRLNIVDGTPGTGPGFWIQSDPGVSGQLTTTPNISSRDVLGVANNGEDLGTVTFNVPQRTAQQFYYDLPWVNGGATAYGVDLVTTLDYDQINGIPVATFLATYGGIDGIRELNGRTLIFSNAAYDPAWGPTFEEIFGVWQINYVTVSSVLTIQLTSSVLIPELTKFNILYGNEYASTGWFKNDAGFLREIPLLTAIQDTLWYQDGTDPEIFGRIRLVEPGDADTLDIDEILGRTSYTSPNGVVFTNGLKVVFRGSCLPASYEDNEYYVSGVGTAIQLLPVENFITPEAYVIDENGAGEAIPDQLDYITIDRGSPDLNAWTRSNRWFHIDVINATAEYNNTVANIDNNFRAKRPIIEFRPGIRMFDMGTQGVAPVNVIDFEETDAFSNVEGKTSYEIDGYTLVEGSRVIFAADEDADVRGKIYVVNFVIPDSVPPLIAQPIINLVLAGDGDTQVDQCTVCLDGDDLAGISFWFDGVDWTRAQQKTGVQQPPLFNVYDANGISFSNIAVYPSSTFEGTKLFSYASPETGILDPILQFPLQYLNLTNVGDIVFENNLYKDTFLYVRDNVSTTEPISSGFVREYASRTVFARKIGWNTAATTTKIRQQFRFTYANEPLVLDVQAQSQGGLPALQVFVGSQFRDPDTYSYITDANTTTITLDDTFVPGDVVEVLALSDQISRVAFYQVPINLEKNPLNGNSDSFTLGTIRTHYESICENLVNLTGVINGANNSRDLGNIGPYGLIILQQSAPLTLAGYFNRSQDYNIFAALQYNSREYQKFKNLMLEEVTKLTLNFETAGEIMTEAIANITAGRTESNPFYWSDMLPAGSVYVQTVYTVSLITTNVFDTTQVYNYTSSNYLGLVVYKNDELLVRGRDYTVATDGPRITVLIPLAVGDTITLQEFASTFGSFVPNTPTKMGLYPAFRPGIITVTTSTGSAEVVVGHDGSQTPIFGDVRDSVLLEFETRIYNNLKLDGNPVPLTIADVLPGQFRVTGYSFSEINNILATDFLSYVGWNKLDYTSQTYAANNEFTWNYSGSQNRLDNQNLLGAWRGIYRYFYDTQQPEQTPWQMLGFTIEPSWWQDIYGAAPYTSDNLVLWDDLEAGRVADPAGSYILPQYARPGLTQVIPVDSEGNLQSPFNAVVGSYDINTFQRSWVAGDGGPVEASWWNSSAYPFAVMRVLALTKPAQFYSLFADRDLYKFDAEFGQYLYDSRYRLDANGIQVYGDGVSKASFINWIVDFNRQTGLDSTDLLTQDLANLDVRLCYRMASFSDKQYIKLYTEKSSPNSTNTALLIPDESYDLLLYKNQPFDRNVYSSVVVQLVENGYAVYGYSTAQPFFNILVSQNISKLKPITVGNITIKVPTIYTNQVAQVPYGFVFTNPTSVADFLLSYGRLLEEQGLTFDDRGNGIILNWEQMVQEFLYWIQQGWEVNSLINLNPLASGLTITKPGAVVDSIATQTSENVLLNQNRKELPTRNLNIVRLENTLEMTPLTTESLSYADLRFTSFEHMIVLNNQSVFGDLIYEPITGARQSRLNLVAVTSTDWNGTVDAQGFILNQDNVEEWTGLRKYAKGEIVRYKDQFWSAATIVDPSPTFNFNQWLKSDYEQIELGLLPNIANKADQLANTYSINTANLENDNDLLAYGLIGFRPRQYMAALNLDDVSQVNIYSQFLKSKGTILSAELLSQANLGKEAADYDIFENWAVQRAVYGANANRSFVELRLDRALLGSNPSLVQVILPQQVSQADQTILLSDVWRESYKLTSPDYLPTTNVTVTDTALPTAGYVNLDDVDVTTFDLSEPDSLDADIDSIDVGATIWVAKVNDYDWNIYRAVQVPGFVSHVCDNLDGTSLCYFTKPHGLSVTDQLVIRYFEETVDGVYEVLSVPSINAVTIPYTFVGSQTAINGTGLGFTLQTQRVAQASDVVNLPYATDIQTGAKVWVDDDGTGHWQVLEKQNIFTEVVELAPDLLDASEQYGAAIAQSKNRLAVFVGSSRYGFGAGTEKGGIYVYVKDFTEQYVPVSPLAEGDAVLTLDATGVRGYGNAVDFGNQTWAVAGASASLGPGSQPNVGYAAVIYRDPVLGQPGLIPYGQWQLLTPPLPDELGQGGEFGYAVTMSADERWMYIGAPGRNLVYAYGRVDWEDQYVVYVGDGATKAFDFGDQLRVSAATQIQVTVNSNGQRLNVDYTVNTGLDTVTFVTAPADDAVVRIQRINRQALDSDSYINVTGTTSGSGTGAVFVVERVRGEVGQPGSSAGSVRISNAGTGYVAGDTITIPAASFGGGSSPANDIVLTVTAPAVPGPLNSFSIAYTPPALANEFNLGQYFYTATNIDSFSVFVDGVLQRPNIDYVFSDDVSSLGGRDLVLLPACAAYNTPGKEIEAQAQGYFQFVDSITVPGLATDARFGHSVATTTDGRQVLIGCKNETVDGKVQAGSVYVFDRNVQRFVYTGTSSLDFMVLGTVVEPVSVIVNNVFYTNEEDAAPNQSNTFSVTGNIVTVDGDLQVGDVIEIETNQFKLLQQISQDTVAEFVNFGQAVDICAYNCTAFVGAPQDSVQEWKAGSVQVSVNQSRVYGSILSVNANPTLTPGNTLRVNNQDVTIPAATSSVTSLQALANAINAEIVNVSASVTNGRLSLRVKNTAAAPAGNKLQVAPGSIGTAFTDLGFETFVYTQTIYSPYATEFAGFGSSLSIDDTAENLVVGAPKGTIYIITEFDDGTTWFDAKATTFFTVIVQSGSVYTFDYLPSADASAVNPGKFVFGLQVVDGSLDTYHPLDAYGTAVNYTDGVLAVGAPGQDAGDSTLSDYGRVYVYENPNRSPAWTVLRQQQPVVDIRLLNGVFTYDRITSAKTEFFDFFDPLQGKILGAAQQNLNYIGAVDPAQYNTGPINNRGNTWAADHVGEMWWDISTVRFIDPNQDDIIYGSRRWGQVFPGSQVDVYQWVQSTQPPSGYTGPGIPRNVFSYTMLARLGVDGTFNTYYYFWVRAVNTVYTQQGKTLSAETVARYIENPKASGIPYIAPINASTIAIYNGIDAIQAEDTIINIEFDREFTNDNVHVEYELIPQGREDGFLSQGLYRKLQDSFCGVDTAGNLVPDPNLNPAERYGVQFRPRQSMFTDRFVALQNYIVRVNSVLKLYPISESRSFVLLNSAEPEPAAGATGADAWNLRVANLEILSFQDIYAVPLGYRYLVASDSSNNGLWTIYAVEPSETPLLGTRTLVLQKVQNFDTRRYWNYIDWYRPGYNSSTKIAAEVPNFSALNTLSLPVGSSVRVAANAQGKFEIYLLEDTGWQRVGLEDGTIAISAEIYDYALGRFGFDVEVFDAQYFDQEPVIETRQIIKAINEELFVGDLLIERNRALTLMFNFVLSEFSAPEWLVKTSLIDVDHRIRNLEPFQNYRQDNQEFVLDYIQEVKPYHVQIREFNLLYNGNDNYFGDLTDFDVPAYYNTSLEIPRYTSPVLLPYALSAAEPDNTLSDAAPDAAIWQEWPYTQWFGNYLLTLESIRVTDSGSGYTDIPEVTILGDAEVAATAVAVINSQGRVVQVTLTSPGSGYRSTPSIVFNGGNGSGARAYAVMDNGLVRSFRTVIKYDRTQYRSQITDWSPNGTYEDGTLVRYNDVVWRAESQDSTAVVGPTFNLEDWVEVPASQLSGVDRTRGYYVAGVNEPGLDLPLLIDGIDYPGVQVYGQDFYIPPGSPDVLDAEYASEFTDVLLGDRFTDINVDGGEFIGLYEGHAPEELVNGSEFDTVDIRVYTRPGSDWSKFDSVDGENGHGFQISSRRYEYNGDDLSWAGLVENPAQIIVSNVTTGTDLVINDDYQVDWVNRTVDINAGATSGDIIDISVYEVGGGSQLYRNTYNGDDIVGDSIIVPVNTAEIYDIACFLNSEQIDPQDWEPYTPGESWNILEAYDRLAVVYTTGPTTYYRALQAVPAGIEITNTAYWENFVPTRFSKVIFSGGFTSTDLLSVTVLGITSPVQYSWSTPVTQDITVTSAIASSQTAVLSNNVGGTNAANMIVCLDGKRLQPYECIEWFGDDSSTEFGLPQRGDYQQSIINSATDITVWIDNQLQVQGVNYGVTNWDGSNVPGRQVQFVTPPASGARILIAVSTIADYVLVGSQLQLRSAPSVGQTLSVTTFNDTAEQDLLTVVFVGPTGSPPVNDFDLQRSGLTANRVWVTINGNRLFEGENYSIQGQYLVLASGTIGASDVVAVTEFAETVVPEAMTFRIFQDMRGVQATFRITPATTTVLAQDLSATATTAYVVNAGALTQPDLENGVFGVCTINGERIMYRNRDLGTNSITGLIRGTAGTGAAAHVAASEVYDMGRGNLLDVEYQDRIVKDTSIGDGSTVIFDAPNIRALPDLPQDSSTQYIDNSIEVYVGGTRQYAISDLDVPSQYRYTVATVDPLSIEFITGDLGDQQLLPPPSGVEVTIAQRVGLSWYEPGTPELATEIVPGNSYFIWSLGSTDWLAIGAGEAREGVLFTATAVGTGTGQVKTASNGVALQESETKAARFFRGL